LSLDGVEISRSRPEDGHSRDDRAYGWAVTGTRARWRDWRVLLLCVIPVVLAVVLVREIVFAPTTEGPQRTAPQGRVLHTFDYDDLEPGADVAGREGVWQGEQEPHVDDELKANRIRVVAAEETPAGEGQAPAGNVMRVELRPYDDGDGDVTETQGYEASRAEVFGRQPEKSDGEATEWPDPEGSTRWYSFSVYLESPWKFTDKDDRWLTLTQWKGARTGRPPVALELRKDSWRLGGKGGVDSLGEAAVDTWVRFAVGLHFSPDPDVGWAEVWIDDEQVLPRTHRATLNTKDGETDPAYLKQGIYRSKDWNSTHVAYFGPLTIGTTRDSVT
jgi:hypothetical protein